MKKLDHKLVIKEINQIAIFKAIRLMVHDLVILVDERETKKTSKSRRS
jgi:hypothetical protein